MTQVSVRIELENRKKLDKLVKLTKNNISNILRVAIAEMLNDPSKVIQKLEIKPKDKSKDSDNKSN